MQGMEECGRVTLISAPCEQSSDHKKASPPAPMDERLPTHVQAIAQKRGCDDELVGNLFKSRRAVNEGKYLSNAGDVDSLKTCKGGRNANPVTLISAPCGQSIEQKQASPPKTHGRKNGCNIKIYVMF